MVAAPQYATMVVTDGRSNINVDLYLSDVANGEVNFDSGAGAAATSKTFWKSPISGRIVDFTILTGMTDTTKVKFVIDGASTRSIIRFANHLNTLPFRPNLNIPINAGEDVGLTQLA